MGRTRSMAEDSGKTGDIIRMGNSSESTSPDRLEWDTSANLCTRLVRAQHDAKRLEKTPAKNGMKFDYVTHDDIAQEAKRILAKNGILFLPSIERYEQDGNRTIVSVSAALINADKPEETFNTSGLGYGVDQQDKGPGKAYSYAVKYILAKTLLLNTSDDIEQHNIDYTPSPEQIAEKTEADIKGWFKSFSDQIENTQSYEQLKQLKTDNLAMLNSPAVPNKTKDAILEKLNAKIELAKEALLHDEAS